MNVKRITMRGFMSHAHTDVTLPDRGIVVVTGPNGSGKSSLVEAVSFALWGKTLRGSKPWADGVSGSVTVETDAMVSHRKGTASGSTKSEWQPSGWLAAQMALAKDVPEYETSSKYQEALEHVHGTHEVWRRSSAFSSSDAAHFSTATDSERKRLLEAVLGLERFDAALEKCRTELKAVGGNVTLWEMTVAREGAALAEAERALLDHVVEAQYDLAAFELTERNARAMAASVEADVSTARATLLKIERADREAGTALRAKEAELQRVNRGSCPTCGQSTQDVADALRAEVLALEVQLRAEVAARTEELAAARAEASQLEQEKRELVDRHTKAKDNLAEARAAQRGVELAEQRRSAALARVEKLQEALVGSEATLVVYRQQQAELIACDQVLGTKGVRAHVLDRALNGIEAAANVWLARMTGGEMKLKLKSYSEKKSGGVSDSISMEVDGAGGGYGYKGMSGGERRRVDVALLMALSSVAAASSGNDLGTLFADECFDALDTDGVDAVSRALEEAAKDRCVVVVTHNDELAKALNAVARWRVTNGTVTT